MNRITVIQYLIDTNNFTNYLEIGTQKGKSFFPIKCRKKIAVDPNFQFSLEEKLKSIYLNKNNFRNKYFEKTSDDFFKEEKVFLRNNGPIDIVFVDGLHTFKASLLDTLNSLKYLQSNGFIVLHDCFPPHEAASITAENSDFATEIGSKMTGWTGEWCGDTWKTVVYLRKKYREHLRVCVIDTDYGLGIVKFLKRENLDLNIDDKLFQKVNELKYSDLVKNPVEMLGLIDLENFLNI